MRQHIGIHSMLAIGLFVASACTLDASREGAAISEATPQPDGNGYTCEPKTTVPVHLTTGLEPQVGEMVLVTGSPSHFGVALQGLPGWTYGEIHIYLVGDGGWFHVSANETPDVSGYLTSIYVDIPLADVGLSCGESFVLNVRAVVRNERDYGRHFASAYGSTRLTPPTHGWKDIYEICCSDEVYGCTYTRGYWANHEESWPVLWLTLGSSNYTQSDLLEVLGTPARGDASVILAAQLITALLNVAAGASGTPAIGEAQSWMSANGGWLPYGTPAESVAGAQAVAIAAQLAAYNEGASGPGHCD